MDDQKLIEDNFDDRREKSETGEEEEEEDQTWVLDSLVGFLKSPLWSTSLNDFTDRNSIIFDPDDIEDDDGNILHRPEYEKIFHKYRSLIDQLIESHMNELNINEKQFSNACQMADGLLAKKLKRILFEELLAAENYDVFVRLMAKRNVELQLEALDILVRKYGLIYDVFVPIGTSRKNFLSEEHILREAIIRSLNDLDLDEEEMKTEEVGEEEEKENLKTSAIKTNVKVDVEPSMKSMELKQQQNKAEEEDEEEDVTSNETDKETVQRDAKRLVEVKQKIDRKMNEALTKMAMSQENDDEEEEQDEEEENSEEETIGGKSEDTGNELSLEQNIDRRQQEPDDDNDNLQTKRRISIEEIDKRANYLRKQRDKILKQRKKDRNERISKYLINSKGIEKSNNNDNDDNNEDRNQIKNNTPSSSSDQSQQTKSSSSLAFRKTLAQRLKAEVIMGNTSATITTTNLVKN